MCVYQILTKESVAQDRTDSEGAVIVDDEMLQDVLVYLSSSLDTVSTVREPCSLRVLDRPTVGSAYNNTRKFLGLFPALLQCIYTLEG